MRLNLGSGHIHAPPPWINVDKVDYGHNLVADVLEGLPMEDETFDFVLMNHTLQMFHYDELPVVLAEVRRVMKDGATLRILTPDLKKAIGLYNEHHSGDLPISYDLEHTYSGRVFRYIFWHGDTRCGFDVNSLIDLLKRNGFTKAHSAKFGECELDSRESESLIVVCKK